MKKLGSAPSLLMKRNIKTFCCNFIIYHCTLNFIQEPSQTFEQPHPSHQINPPSSLQNDILLVWMNPPFIVFHHSALTGNTWHWGSKTLSKFIESWRSRLIFLFLTLYHLSVIFSLSHSSGDKHICLFFFLSLFSPFLSHSTQFLNLSDCYQKWLNHSKTQQNNCMWKQKERIHFVHNDLQTL